MIPIVPALIPADEAAVRHTLERLAFANEIHLDVVDGAFVPSVSWPYQPAGEPTAVKPYTDQFTLEVDLMVVDPLPAAVNWITAGADMLVFHCETLTLENFKNFEEYTHVTVSICAHGDTPVSTLLEYAEYADGVQLMGIHEIGAQGLPFDEAVIEKISEVKAAYPDKPVTVDGSVNHDTVARLVAAGADRLIVGSAITLQPDPAAAHTALQSPITK